MARRLAETAEHVAAKQSGISARTGQLSKYAFRKQRIKEARARAAAAAAGRRAAASATVAARAGGAQGSGGTFAERFATAAAVAAAEEAGRARQAALDALVVQFPVVIKVT